MRSILKNVIDIDLTSDTLPVENVLTSIETQLREQRHIIHNLLDFHERHQRGGETFDSFYYALKEIAANFDLSSMTVEEEFVIRILTGISDSEVHRKLMAEINLTHRILNICHSEETSR